MGFITDNCMPYIPSQELSEEEKAMPCSKYFTDYKLYAPNPVLMQILDEGPMPVEDAIPIEHWLDHLTVHGYPKRVYGYTMMPGGYGFYIEYSVSPAQNWSGRWRGWYGQWYNHYSKSTTGEHGNIRYKIWNPVDHWDHKFVNGVDDTDGVWSLETLDNGATGDPSKGIPAVSHNFDVRDYGLSEERYEELQEADCSVDACWEEFDGPGHHLVLRFSRPCPTGGRESMNCEWMGFYPKDGKIIRDESTPVDETYLKNVLMHNTMERQHLYQVLPDLYAEYHDKPMDAD